MTLSSATPRSRRDLLVASVGALAALVASALGRPALVDAAAGAPLIIGSESNNAGTSTTQLLTTSSVAAFKLLQHGPGTALMGYTTPASGTGRGVYGRTDSPDGSGVQARNAADTPGSGAAISAIGGFNHGVIAHTSRSDKVALGGSNNEANGTAVSGFADQGNGVFGASTSGSGVRGRSMTGYAGRFEGPVSVSKQLDLAEIAVDPGNAPTSTARIFVRDNGSGKTQLCVIFASGLVQVLAAQA